MMKMGIKTIYVYKLTNVKWRGKNETKKKMICNEWKWHGMGSIWEYHNELWLISISWMEQQVKQTEATKYIQTELKQLVKISI